MCYRDPSTSAKDRTGPIDVNVNDEDPQDFWDGVLGHVVSSLPLVEAHIWFTI